MTTKYHFSFLPILTFFTRMLITGPDLMVWTWKFQDVDSNSYSTLDHTQFYHISPGCQDMIKSTQCVIFINYCHHRIFFHPSVLCYTFYTPLGSLQLVQVSKVTPSLQVNDKNYTKFEIYVCVYFLSIHMPLKAY